MINKIFQVKIFQKTKLISIIIGNTVPLLALVLTGTCFYLVKRRRRIYKSKFWSVGIFDWKENSSSFDKTWIFKDNNEKSLELQLLFIVGERVDENDELLLVKKGRSKECAVVKLDLIRALTQNCFAVTRWRRWILSSVQYTNSYHS